MRYYRLIARNAEGKQVWQQRVSDKKALDVLEQEEKQGEAYYILLERKHKPVLEAIREGEVWKYVIH